ncbi:MAG TPA: diguanylate cyclase [Gaiellaceae bacterium]|nr:diguanylate cyclase [Gaiellaceae bacterium]
MAVALDALGGRPASYLTRALVLRAGSAAAVLGLAFLAAHLAFGVGGHGLDKPVDTWLDDALEVLAAAGCLLRAAWVRSERAAWLVLGLGVASFALGDCLYDFYYGANPPSVSLSDAAYLAFYPASYVGLVLLIRPQIRSFSRSILLDGAMAALAITAIGASVVFEAVLEHTTGSRSAVIVNLAYPLGDIFLVALVVFVFSISGWRPGRAWAAIGLAFALSAVADGIYLFQVSTNSDVEGTLLDAIWPASLLLLAASAWQQSARRHHIELEGRPLAATPIVCGLGAVGVFVADRFQHVNPFAISLAGATIATVLLRTGLTLRENVGLLDRARTQSLTDALTGLGNRRSLLADLERMFEPAPADDSSLLIIFDLNGFKHYNDTFGHPAGDALLARLAGKLERSVGSYGGTYRLGGDEFCVLAAIEAAEAERLLDATTAALTEAGESFDVSTAFGAVFLPEEAADTSAALKLADERLYAQKRRLHGGRRGEPYEVLLRVLTEREPSLREHVDSVAKFSVAVGSRFGLADTDLDVLRRAAELHDVGKLAIPDSVLQKPGPLDEAELEFVRKHTIIGQRILAGSPALRAVGEIVRATHERWDGTGYADGLAGEEIPLSARIIAVCDAYAAMTTDRPYRRPVSSEAALEEIRRCSGTQFDPKVVDLFVAEVRATGLRAESAGA